MLKNKVLTIAPAVMGAGWLATEVIRPSILQGAMLAVGGLVAVALATAKGRKLTASAAKQGIAAAEQAEVLEQARQEAVRVALAQVQAQHEAVQLGAATPVSSERLRAMVTEVKRVQR